MIMEKGISSVEVPPMSAHATAVRTMVKEHEAKPAQKVRRVGFVLVHAGTCQNITTVDIVNVLVPYMVL